MILNVMPRLQILGRGAEAIQLLRRAFNLRIDAKSIRRSHLPSGSSRP